MVDLSSLDGREKLILFLALKHFENDLRGHPINIHGNSKDIKIDAQDAYLLREELMPDPLAIDIGVLRTLVDHGFREMEKERNQGQKIRVD